MNAWGQTCSRFGSLDSKLAIIGLAPAAHGGARTEEHLLEINQEIFYLNVYMKLVFQIIHIQKI